MLTQLQILEHICVYIIYAIREKEEIWLEREEREGKRVKEGKKEREREDVAEMLGEHNSVDKVCKISI